MSVRTLTATRCSVTKDDSEPLEESMRRLRRFCVEAGIDLVVAAYPALAGVVSVSLGRHRIRPLGLGLFRQAPFR